MQAKHQSGSDAKATTASRYLLATAMIGAALISYQIHKTPDARARLQTLAAQAHTEGDISDRDIELVAQLLASRPKSIAPTVQI